MKRLWEWSASILICTMFPSASFGQQAQAVQVVRTKWDPAFTIYGLSQDEFNQNHLWKLTAAELKNVATSVYLSGFSDGMGSVTPSCGPQVKDPDLSTVKLFVDMPDTTNTELASALRSHLRAIPDVRLVFTEGEADMTLNVLGFSNELKNGTVTGYTLSYSASRACIVSTGKATFKFDINLSADLQTAASVEQLMSGITANIDAKVCEKVREWNASAKKSAQ